MQIPAAGGEPGVIVKPEGDEMPWYPQVLPRTGAILFTLSEMGPDAGELQVLLTETGERRSVLPNAVAGRVLETGHLVFVRSGALWAAPIDQERLEIVGNPVPVVDGVSVGPGGEVQYAVADTGTLVYVPGAVAEPWLHERTTLALVDRQGSVENLPVPLNEYAVPRFSPDGTRIAAQISSGDGSNIFIFERSNNRLRQLTFDGGERPIWTPDGAQITFLAKNALWNITSDFSEEPQLLSTDDEEFRIVAPLSWSPDGRVLLLAVWPDAGMVWGSLSSHDSKTAGWNMVRSWLSRSITKDGPISPRTAAGSHLQHSKPVFRKSTSNPGHQAPVPSGGLLTEGAIILCGPGTGGSCSMYTMENFGPWESRRNQRSIGKIRWLCSRCPGCGRGSRVLITMSLPMAKSSSFSCPRKRKATIGNARSTSSSTGSRS